MVSGVRIQHPGASVLIRLEEHLKPIARLNIEHRTSNVDGFVKSLKFDFCSL